MLSDEDLLKIEEIIRKVLNEKKPKKQEKVSDMSTIEVIIKYLNEKTGANYKHTTTKYISLINKLLKDKYSVEDIKLVIDTKSDEWLKDEVMSKYLRPETLFGTKFASYYGLAKSKSLVQGVNLKDVDM